VVIKLAVFFAYHVLWPDGFDAGFEWVSLIIGAAAFIALFRYKLSILLVIGACALVGFAYAMLGVADIAM
jgi:chromate transporter